MRRYAYFVTDSERLVLSFCLKLSVFFFDLISFVFSYLSCLLRSNLVGPLLWIKKASHTLQKWWTNGSNERGFPCVCEKGDLERQQKLCGIHLNLSPKTRVWRLLFRYYSFWFRKLLVAPKTSSDWKVHLKRARTSVLSQPCWRAVCCVFCASVWKSVLHLNLFQESGL
jgi:hypothetical protein